MTMVTFPARDQFYKKMVPPQDLVQPSSKKADWQKREDDLTRTLKLRMTDPKLQATAQRLYDDFELSPSLKPDITPAKPHKDVLASGTTEETHNADNDADDGHTNAKEGDPWKIADVSDWLEDLGFTKYIGKFRKQSINGMRLLQLQDVDLQQMGMSSEDARNLLSHIQTLKASTVPVSSDAPEWIRRTLVVKEIDAQVRLFDAATGEEVFQLADDIARQLLADGTLRRSRSNVANDDEDETEFAWVGDTKGWVRRVGGGQMLYEAEWTLDDLCAWLRHVNLDVCVPVAQKLRLTPRRFKQLHPDDQEELGHEHGIGNALVDAWRLFNLRVFARHAAANAPTPATSASASASAAERSSRSLPPYVDVFAQLSPWCRIDEPRDKVAASLMDAAPPNAFAIVRDPADPQQLQLLVVMPPFGLKTLNICVEASKLRLETTRYLCADVSELVHIFASDNDDRAWLLNLETPLEEHLNRRWFMRSMTTEEARAQLVHQRLGSFMVYPANFEDVYTLAFVSEEGVEMRNVLLRNEGYQLEGGSHQVFPTLTDLVNHYTFVRSNDLGTVLFQDPADFQATKHHETAAWYRPELTREGAEASLTGMPDGSFLVRHSEHIQASFVLSYIYADQVRHRLIDQDSEGLTFFRESVRAFKSLADLVAAYCAEHLDDLPCQLLLPTEQQQPMASAQMQNAADVTAPAVPLDPVYGHGSFPWLQLSPITKTQALSTLVDKPDGAFVVRSSERAPEYLSLSYVYGDEIHHELIGILHPETDDDSGVYLLSVPDRVFETIYDLVTYYKLNAGELHCALVETDAAPAPAFVRERAPWLVLGLPRDEAVSLLQGKPPGSFLVRESQSSPSHLVLCLVDPDGVIVQEYIEMGEQGVFLEKNPDACFRSLHDLVHFYCDPRPELPCSLVLYDTPLWHASATSLSETGMPTLAQRNEERLTLESQRAASMRARSRPELFQDNDPHFYVQHANDRTAELTAMRSGRTLKWRSFTDPSAISLARDRIQGSAARLSSQQQQQQQQQRRHHHQRRHQQQARRHMQSGGSRTFGDNLFGDREDDVKRTCRRLGLYASPEDRPWMCLQQPLTKVRHLLQNQGDFVVHKSAEGNYGCLTMLLNGELVSRELLRRDDGVGLQGSQVSFDRLTRLIEHYVHPAQTDLPACLGPHSM